MALPSTGSISLSQVNQELGKASPYNQVISLNDAALRALFGVPSGAISMSSGFGKAAGTFYMIAATNAAAFLYPFVSSHGLRMSVDSAGATYYNTRVGSGNVLIKRNKDGTQAYAWHLTSTLYPTSFCRSPNGAIYGMGNNQYFGINPTTGVQLWVKRWQSTVATSPFVDARGLWNDTGFIVLMYNNVSTTNRFTEIRKFDTNGNQTAAYGFKPPTNYAYGYAQSFEQDPINGNIYFCGSASASEFFFAKMSPTGTILWQKKLNVGGGLADTATSVSSDGNYVVFVTGGLTTRRIFKFNAAGTLLWQRAYTCSGGMSVYQSNGDIYIYGKGSTGTAGIMHLVKIDTNGNFVFCTSITRSGTVGNSGYFDWGASTGLVIAGSQALFVNTTTIGAGSYLPPLWFSIKTSGPTVGTYVNATIGTYTFAEVTAATLGYTTSAHTFVDGTLVAATPAAYGTVSPTFALSKADYTLTTINTALA